MRFKPAACTIEIILCLCKVHTAHCTHTMCDYKYRVQSSFNMDWCEFMCSHEFEPNAISKKQMKKHKQQHIIINTICTCTVAIAFRVCALAIFLNLVSIKSVTELSRVAVQRRTCLANTRENPKQINRLRHTHTQSSHARARNHSKRNTQQIIVIIIVV